MFLLRGENRQVAGIIILLVAVDMMNNFSGLQWPANSLLRHNPVLVAAEALGVGFAFAAGCLCGRETP